MKTRILTALILACVLAAAFFQPFPALPTVVVSVLCAIMTWEILRCTGLLKKRIFLVPSMLFAVLTPILAYTELKGAFAAAIVLLMVYLFICCVQYGQIDLSQALTTAALLMYAVGCMVCLIRIDRTPLRFSAHPDMPTGRLFWLLCLLCAALTDVFAYFGGTLFGKKKLCPKLSPHKTVEGSLFGLGGSVLTWLAFGGIFSVFCGAKVHFGMFVLFGLLTAAAAECGDLFASLIKRTYKIKDFGTILPGHGGIFDRFDSLLPVAAMMSAILCDGRFTSLLMTL